ncbi:MAG TPA: CocE/NonD family hydrolase [Ilumatobacteraceae bacterium]|nr:CocE/NonD family hydrolase [Ilumatobacteraceae bacterium]
MPAVDESVEVVETAWIDLPGRPRLAARLWLPANSATAPVPAVLEFLPYRRRDSTAARDESTYPALARAGYAGVRVDMRGTGDSDGLYDDEYSETELADAGAVIGWIADQPWCTGAVGMMGISWGGFNALQVAARRPPALKAVISIASSVDRYNDDIHYRNGCQLGAQLGWATTVLGYISRPPDSDVVGVRWRQMWLDRLEAIEPASLTWIAHQCRDGFWKRGSIGEDFDAVEVPVLVIAGWADGYRNTPVKAVAGLQTPSKALNGPWIHKYPHFALPRPRVDFHAEAVRWWDRWLRGIENGAEHLPQQRAFISEAVRPTERSERETGRWVSRHLGGDRTSLQLHLTGNSGLSLAVPERCEVVVDTAEICGADAGVFFVVDPATELPGDQRIDDSMATVFDSSVLDEAVEVLGRTRLRLRVAIDQPQGNLIARLEDVHPDGASHRVAMGVLNLSHRESNESPVVMEPGRFEHIDVLLDDTGYRFLAGHRIRLAVSTSYFPMVLPPPTHVRAIIAVGEGSFLEIPTPQDLVDIELAEPPEGLLPVYEQLSAGSARRDISRSSDGATVSTSISSDSGEVVHPANGMVWREIHESVGTITAGDPLSFECIEQLTVIRRRSGIETRCIARGRLTATATAWHVEASLEAFENDSVVFAKSWTDDVERDHQ